MRLQPLAALRRAVARLRRRPAPHLDTGRRGERLAARHLRRAGYRLLERNRVLGRDEADLLAVAPDGRTLVIVEVKTRRGSPVAPETAIDRAKRRRLSRFAARLRRSRRYADRPLRFDVVTVRLSTDAAAEVRHYVGAF